MVAARKSRGDGCCVVFQVLAGLTRIPLVVLDNPNLLL